jgi:hypothetical protein
MSEIIGYIFIIALFWFILYWILGGVIFAVISIMSVAKIKRAQFSCLFTLLSMGAAFGAAYFGTSHAEDRIFACLAEEQDVFGQLASVIGCGILEQVVSGAFWFIVLIGIGIMAFIFSRATNQSWVDSDKNAGDELDILEI